MLSASLLPYPARLLTTHHRTTHTQQTPDTYTLTAAEIDAYKRDGYVRLPGFLTEEELEGLEAVFDKFMRGEVPVPGKDFCDMVR